MQCKFISQSSAAYSTCGHTGVGINWRTYTKNGRRNEFFFPWEIMKILLEPIGLLSRKKIPPWFVFNCFTNFREKRQNKCASLKENDFIVSSATTDGSDWDSSRNEGWMGWKLGRSLQTVSSKRTWWIDLMRREKLLAWEISERNNQLKVNDDFAPNLE